MRDPCTALAEIGYPAVPTLVASDDSEARRALGDLGTDLKGQGTILWWVIPRVYWREFVGLPLLIVVWFALAARFPRHRPVSKLKQTAHLALTAAVPSTLACGAIGYAVTREWAQGFLPDPVLTAVPLPVATVLSVGFVCVLAAVGICWRKQPGAPEVSTA